MYITPEKRSKFEAIFKDIKVTPFNSELLAVKVSEFNKKDYSISEVYCLINGTLIVIDNECVGKVCKNIDERIEFMLYKRSIGEKKTFEDLLPVNSANVPLSYLVANFAQPEISLFEFMGDRFLYNGRVRNNMQIILEDLKIKATW